MNYFNVVEAVEFAIGLPEEHAVFAPHFLSGRTYLLNVDTTTEFIFVYGYRTAFIVTGYLQSIQRVCMPRAAC